MKGVADSCVDAIHEVKDLRRYEAHACTYNDDTTDKGRVYEEVARLGEPRRLAFETAAVLVQEEGIHQDAKLGFCDEEASHGPP